MNCQKCGNVLAPESTICSACGTPVNNQNMQSMNVNNQPDNNDDVLVFGAPEVQAPAPVQQMAPTPVQPATPVPPVAPVQQVAQAPVQAPVAPIPVQPATPVPPVAPVQQMAPTPMQPSAPVNNAMPMGQPNMYSQQPMPNAYPEAQPSYGNPMPQPKKSNGAFYAVLGVLAVAIVGVVVYILFFMGDKGTQGNEVNNGNNTVTPGNNTGNNSGSNGGNVADSGTKIGNYSFTIPTGYVYQQIDERDVVVDKSNQVIAGVTIIEGYSYETFSSAKDELKDEIKGAKSVTEETYGGRKWLVITSDVDMDGKTIEGKQAVTAIDSNNCVAYELYNLGTKSYSSIYSELGAMTDSAKYNGVAGFSGNVSDKPAKLNQFDVALAKKHYDSVNATPVDTDLPSEPINDNTPGVPIDDTIEYSEE